MKTSAALVVSGSLLAIALAAAPEEVLKVGSKAPALSLESFVQGEEVKEFEAGTPYVVEFWATWCPPCVTAVPHLNKLQTEHPEVVFIGVAGSQREKTPEAQVAAVKTFIDARKDQMTYRVALDADRSMSKAWMEPAKQRGIPCAFVVDAKGKISFIGHPSDKSFDQAVEKVAEKAKKSKAKAKPSDSDAGSAGSDNGGAK
ncbi:MAG: TlpA disulfide reductase family protein [Planctomycetota bacterium]|nr:TlpA disulfide reductase family protein [Planctomycetota bacterium]MDA1106229.1 TlpA disulfide reductase family protein [Planctomycetota bacterium]